MTYYYSFNCQNIHVGFEYRLRAEAPIIAGNLTAQAEPIAEDIIIVPGGTRNIYRISTLLPYVNAFFSENVDINRFYG